MRKSALAEHVRDRNSRCSLSQAQSSAKRPQFEVASIKRNTTLPQPAGRGNRVHSVAG
jgi:hypothetical protein